MRAGRRSSRCVRTCVPTSTETPIERGSVTRRDGQGVDRGNGSGSRASPGGRPGASLPRVRGPLDQADRRSSRSLSGDGQGVLLRPDRGEGAGGQGALRRRVPRLRRRTRSRATARATPTRTARRAIPGAIERHWTRERVLEAMHVWRARYGRLPSSYDWSLTHARRRGGGALERLSKGTWPSASVVTRTCGSWRAARAAAAEQIAELGIGSADPQIVLHDVPSRLSPAIFCADREDSGKHGRYGGTRERKPNI